MQNYLDDLNFVADLLLDNKVILSPTDTVWGLGCNAMSQIAVNKIYEIKQRDSDKPLILLVNSIEQLKKYIKHVHPRIETLIHFHQRPLSIVYEANGHLPTYLKNKDNTVAIRVTKNQMLIDLINKINQPLVSTSANIQGSPTPSKYEEVQSNILEKVDYIFKSERKSQDSNPPSMLIKFDEEGELIFLRK